jgi:serine hydrolase
VDNAATDLPDRTVLLIPGIGNSGPEHWQSHWETKNRRCVRVLQRDWEHPICTEWIRSLESAVASSGDQVVVAAHSLGCLLVVHWLAGTTLKISAALLVAVPNPNGPNFPPEALGFDAVPRQRLSCPSLVVGSTNDPYCDIEVTKSYADDWGSRFLNLGRVGHINADSNLGEWRLGQRLLRDLLLRDAAKGGE